MVEAEEAASNRDYAFGVLGPLRVTHGDVPLPLGGRQQRAVLARMLLADGAGLNVDQLADALWGEDVPVGAASTIQTYVFHLRQVLEPDRGRGAPGQVVVTENGRYRLTIASDTLDSVQFERGVDSGERLLADGAPADAVTELDRALALWRGDVLADLADYEFVTPAAARLADRRKAAVEAKIDAELALGRHASVLSQLNELVDHDPLNERLQYQRILALYRCGRPSDALAAYDQLRHHLADELGVDPSPPLQRLYQQVLAHDPALAWTPPSPPRTDAAATPEPERQPQPAPASPLRHRPPWLRARWLVIGIILAVVAAAGIVAAVVVTNQPKHTLAALPPNSIGILDADGSLRDAVLVGQNPDALAYGFGSLWVANSGEKTVQRINPKTHEVIQTIDVGSNPAAIAMSAKNVWVANGSDASVTEIDSATNKVVVARIPVGALPAAVVAGPQGVWVANSGDDNLSLIDIDSAQVVKVVSAGDGPDGLVVEGDSLWVANGADGTISHLDARTGEPLSSARADAGASGPLLADGFLWVANKSASSVTQIDPQSGHVLGTIPVRDGPGSLALAHGAIWTSNEYDGTVSRIDPATDHVTRTYSVGSSPRGLAVAGPDLWLTSAAFANASHKGGTLTFIGSDLNYIDPATAYNPDFGILTRSVYDGLVAYRATSGAAGVAIVPDLAVKLPSPTNGGRTYTFTIRSGVRFSNGDVVQASDVRRGIVRELTIGQRTGNPAVYRAVIGAPACIDHPKHCDLRGVQVDDVAGRITFQLSEADPGFVDKLTLPLVVATPKDAPSNESAKPLAGTGPYQISTFRKGELIELRRNTYFSQWSYAAQPAGYPDVIRYVKPRSSEASEVADILAGRADVMTLSGDQATNVHLRARYSAQLHEQPWFNTQYLTLNVHLPPFDQVATRRAVNYALDRRRFAEILGGEVAARPACQILPPGFPGHVTYCPYAGADFVPDAAMARSLVRSSGTAGMTVDLYGLHHDLQQLQYVASVLRDIGYRPATHLLADDFPDYLRFISEPSHRVQVAIHPGWIPDYPRPDAYFDFLFACPPQPQGNNLNRYCRPEVDELVAKAKSAQLSNPPEALALWGQVEHLIVDDAPVVPTANLVIDAFTSRRVGNVQTTPVLPLLLGQIWVK